MPNGKEIGRRDDLSPPDVILFQAGAGKDRCEPLSEQNSAISKMLQYWISWSSRRVFYGDTSRPDQFEERSTCCHITGRTRPQLSTSRDPQVTCLFTNWSLKWVYTGPDVRVLITDVVAIHIVVIARKRKILISYGNQIVLAVLRLVAHWSRLKYIDRKKKNSNVQDIFPDILTCWLFLGVIVF